jgi:uncharacterized protein
MTGSLRTRLDLLRRSVGHGAAADGGGGGSQAAAAPSGGEGSAHDGAAPMVALPDQGLAARDGAVSATPVAQPPARSLGDRLREMGARMRLDAPAPPIAPRPRGRSAAAAESALAEELGAQPVVPGVLLIERILPLDQGSVGLIPRSRLGLAQEGLPEGVVDPAGVVFLDTETTGLSGGTGTVAFMVGAARVQAGALVVRQYLLTRFAGERALLAAMGEWVGADSGTGPPRLVTFNGRSFDVPLLSTRFRMMGEPDPLPALGHLDLLPITRRAFARRWSDCRLSTAERRLLGLHRVDDLPGSEAPDSWMAFLRRGDPTRLAGVAEHNFLDIVALAALLPVLAEVHADPGRWGADILGVARSHLRVGDDGRALGLLRGSASRLDADGQLELALLHRRRGEWAEACALWEPLATAGHPEALERLAKYHEHMRHDFRTALALAERLPPGAGRERRAGRLRAREQGEGAAPAGTPA